MEKWSERRTLSARRYVGRAEIGNNIQPKPARQQGAVADLPCAPFGRAMQNRVTVKADHIDRSFWIFPEKLLDGLGVQPCQFPFDRSRRTLAAQHRAQPFPELLGIGERHRGPRVDPFAAVGLDHSDVDAVERGAAHQAERPMEPAPGCRARPAFRAKG